MMVTSYGNIIVTQVAVLSLVINSLILMKMVKISVKIVIILANLALAQEKISALIAVRMAPVVLFMIEFLVWVNANVVLQ